MKIFLIGMPGSGKTFLGRQLASSLHVSFIDLDDEIERSENKKISDIFRERGEDYFRLIEARLLGEWATGPQSFVMATGGGAPCFYKGIDVINGSGLSIFIDCPVSTLVSRVKQNKDRPLLLVADEEELVTRLEKMRANRLECYMKATFTTRESDPAKILKMIKARK